MKIEWKGTEFVNDLRDRVGDNLEKAAIFLVDKLKETLNRDQPYKKSTDTSIITRSGGKTIDKKIRSKTLKGVYYYGLSPSLPGEPPKKITGSLQRSVTYVMSGDRQKASVGTAVPYGFWLEVGTGTMFARPWIRPTIAANQDEIAKIIGTVK